MSYAGEYSPYVEQGRVKDQRDKYRAEAHLLTIERDQAVAEAKRLRDALEQIQKWGSPFDAHSTHSTRVRLLIERTLSFGEVGNQK